jgi:signal transduction histidine kinase
MRLFGRLSARLLLLTILFVLLSEVLIYVPSIARFRETWLHDRLNAAIIASLALEAAGERALPDNLRTEILSRAGVLAVSLKRAERRELVLAMAPGIMPAAFYDLDRGGLPSLIAQAFEVLSAGNGRVVRVSGRPEMSRLEVIDIVIDETQLRKAMLAYSGRILALSIVISLITAGLVYLSLDLVFVRPMRRLTANMVTFRANPEDARRIIAPSGRADEIGQAEAALASMQSELRSAFAQQSRLAALGAAVSKINHDLRNILATAQLFSDRFAQSSDPLVQRELPKLVRAIDRATELTTETLRFGRVTERQPQIKRIAVATLIEEVAAALPAAQAGAASLRREVDEGLMAEADPDQLYRILLNLVRNAAQAIEASGRGGSITLRAVREGGRVVIEVADDGPGIPAAVRPHLFEAFASSSGAGTGLGLAISRELARGHGGDLILVRSDEQGTVFRLVLPAEPPRTSP